MTSMTHAMTDTLPTTSAPSQRRGRLMLLLIAVICLLPLLAALYLRFVSPPAPATMAGTALAPAAFPFAALRQPNGQPLTVPEVADHWWVVQVLPGQCDADCAQSLYYSRQARTAQGKHMERVQRLWILSDSQAPGAELLAQHPDLQLATISDRKALAGLLDPSATAALWLVDRRGLLVFRYAADTEPKRFIKELSKLIKL